MCAFGNKESFILSHWMRLASSEDTLVMKRGIFRFVAWIRLNRSSCEESRDSYELEIYNYVVRSLQHFPGIITVLWIDVLSPASKEAVFTCIQCSSPITVLSRGP
jgi:hypothetical protein